MKENTQEDLIVSSPENELNDLIVSENKLGNVISMDDDDNISVEDFVEEDIEQIDDNIEVINEDVELTDEEKKEIHINAIKGRNNNFNPISRPTKIVSTHTETSPIGTKKRVKNRITVGNVTVNKYDSAYKDARKKKNKISKQSRKTSR